MVSDELCRELIKINAIKFGQFKLKSGMIAPIYFDFRHIISYPSIMKMVAEEMWELVKDKYEKKEFTHICGVPFTALPIASSISILKNVPMLMKRKEAKTYGTGALVEGIYTRETKCLIIEDVITTGLSVYETAKALNDLNIKTNDVIVLLDRKQGGLINLEKSGIRVHKLMDIQVFLTKALSMKLITNENYNESMNFVNSHIINNDGIFIDTKKQESLNLGL